MEPQPDITDLLLSCRADGSVVDRVFPLIYDELRLVAHRHLQRERTGHTLVTTALVHEAYMRLVDLTRVEWQDRVHFLSMAARAMRRILVDHARAHRAARRGGGVTPDVLEEHLIAADTQAEEMEALDSALAKLAEVSPRLVRVVECRFFAGLSIEETAGALGISPASVKRDWALARAWLNRELAR